jgi:hypothetical protein
LHGYLECPRVSRSARVKTFEQYKKALIRIKKLEDGIDRDETAKLKDFKYRRFREE